MNTPFNSLPVEVQEDIEDTLRAYDRCHVELYPDGHYEVMTCVRLADRYYSKYIGCYKKDDVFTPEQQILNYVAEFRSFPYPEYKGKKDWEGLASDWTTCAYNEKGDIIFM